MGVWGGAAVGVCFLVFFCNDTATTEIYTLSLHDALPISDAGDCTYVDGICESCSGETDGSGTIVDNDADDDTVCDADEIVGCQYSAGCNYNAAATDAGDCTYVDGICESCSGETDGSGTIVDNDADECGVDRKSVV